jgi:hypothetical protein
MMNPEVIPDSGAVAGNAWRSGRTRRLLWTIAPVAVLLLAAAALRFAIAPALELLPTGYSSEISLVANTQFRETAAAPAIDTHLKGRRIDQVMSIKDNVAIIQGHLDWSTDTGQVTYQTTGIYGVDRRTRTNIAGFGDQARSGQFLFPPNLDSGTVSQVWDPYYSGPRRLSFERTESVGGLSLAVYRFDVSGLDETAAYDFLPEVPEIYHAMTEGHGWLWIEPVSGTLVDVVDQGHTYFVNPANGQSAGDINVWDARYSPPAREELLGRAGAGRLQVLLAGTWGPLTLCGLALPWAVGSLLWQRSRRTKAA